MSREILTDVQIAVLEAVFADEWFRRYFYLTGGTALSAFYLKHRYSEDLDFFTHQSELDGVERLLHKLDREGQLKIVQIQKSPQFLRYEVNGELQIDFAADVQFRVGSPELIESFMVDSIKNIAVNKLCAILGRLDAKDYVDLYFIVQEQSYDIFELLKLGRNKDGGLDPFVWASLLEGAEQLELLPRMIEPFDLEELKKFCRGLRNKILDEIKPE